jgi:hypothetical protein
VTIPLDCHQILIPYRLLLIAMSRAQVNKKKCFLVGDENFEIVVTAATPLTPSFPSVELPLRRTNSHE